MRGDGHCWGFQRASLCEHEIRGSMCFSQLHCAQVQPGTSCNAEQLQVTLPRPVENKGNGNKLLA